MIVTTVAEALNQTALRLQDAGIDDSRLEAELLLAHAGGLSRSRLLARLRDPLASELPRTLEALVRRRLRREPLAYITGHREFFAIDLEVGPGVLIPRPETEMLVEAVLEFASRLSQPRIADVGTGSGAIAVAVAANSPAATVYAVDQSIRAIGIARRNAARSGVQARTSFVLADLLAGLGGFDIIAANLPYVPESEWHQLEPEVRDWEPRAALVGGAAGTEILERLLDDASSHLEPGGVLLAELGAGQGSALGAAARACFHEARVSVRTDFAGHDRLLVVQV